MESRGVPAARRTFVFALPVLLIGVGLLATGWWLRPIAEAQRAVRGGRLRQALTGYQTAEDRFAWMPLAKRLMPSLYDLVVTNQLATLYTLKEYDAVIDKAAATGTPGGHFWTGCALFAKGDLAVLAPDKRMKWLAEAQEAFRRAVETSPADFDAKFNYELTAKAIAAVRKAPNAPRPADLNLLTPSNAQTPRKVG